MCGFEAEIHGKRVIGIAKEKEQAKQEYNRAIARGDGAYLMEEQKADIFQVKVENIALYTECLFVLKESC